uniref:Uncharacterized protein n=1 Tax=viral metagenome TaxID=1070528 RepID=A0A6C0EJE4_9ZZZZ
MISIRYNKQGNNVDHAYSPCSSTFIYEHNHKSKRLTSCIRYIKQNTHKKSEPIPIKKTESNLSQFIQAWS